MINSEGRVLCDSCVETGHEPPTMARKSGGHIKLWGRHHGRWHEQTVSFYELLPEPGTEEYSQIVAELMRRAS